MIDWSELDLKAKKTLFRAILKGDITKNDLIHVNELKVLLEGNFVLLQLVMGDLINYSFDGRKINKSEYDRLSMLGKKLGVFEGNDIQATFNFTPTVSPYNISLSNKEEEISLD